MPDAFWHETGRWAVMVRRLDGSRRMEYERTGLGRKQKGKAFAWAEQIALASSRKLKVDNDPTLGEIRMSYLSWCLKKVDAGEASRYTYDGHRKQLSLICKTTTANGRLIGNLPASKFSGKVLEDLVETWEQAGKSQTTVRNRCASLQAMFNWAAAPRNDREVKVLIESNPIAGYELPKAVYQGDRYAPAAEVGAFLEFVDREAAKAVGKFARFERLTALLVRIVADTGCRPGELCVAEWKHYDPKTKAIVLPPELHKTGRKTNKPRKIVLPVPLAARVEEEMGRPDRHPTHIFCHRIGSQDRERDGAPLGIPWNSNALCKRVRKLRTAAIEARVLATDEGLTRLHLYRLRHSYATNAIQNGVSVGDTAALIGNSTKTTESTYLHYQDEHLREMADRVHEDRRKEE